MDASQIVEASNTLWRGMVEQAVSLGKDATPDDVHRVAKGFAAVCKTSVNAVEQKWKAIRWVLSDGKTTAAMVIAQGQNKTLSLYTNRNRGKFEGRACMQLHMAGTQKAPFQAELERIKKAANLQNREHVIDLLLAHLVGLEDDYWKQMAQGRQT